MPRAKNRVASRERRKKIIKSVKGHFGRAKSTLTTAKEAADHAGQYAYRDRRAKKRTFRSLWLVKINAACHANGLSYNQFISGLKKCNVILDRKILALLAEHDEKTFTQLAAVAKQGA